MLGHAEIHGTRAVRRDVDGGRRLRSRDHHLRGAHRLPSVHGSDDVGADDREDHGAALAPAVESGLRRDREPEQLRDMLATRPRAPFARGGPIDSRRARRSCSAAPERELSFAPPPSGPPSSGARRRVRGAGPGSRRLPRHPSCLSCPRRPAPSRRPRSGLFVLITAILASRIAVGLVAARSTVTGVRTVAPAAPATSFVVHLDSTPAALPSRRTASRSSHARRHRGGAFERGRRKDAHVPARQGRATRRRSPGACRDRRMADRRALARLRSMIDGQPAFSCA